MSTTHLCKINNFKASTYLLEEYLPIKNKELILFAVEFKYFFIGVIYVCWGTLYVNNIFWQ